MRGTQVRVARAVWRARRAHTGTDRAFALYAALMVAIIAVAPLVRALWMVATGPSGLSILASRGASTALAMVVAALWAATLGAGAKRGPALLPPTLLSALTSSGIRRAHALARPVIFTASVIAVVCAAPAALVGAALLMSGKATAAGVAAFILIAAMTGISAAVMWLAGQVLSRAAAPAAFALLLLAAATLAAPQLLPFAPWGWVGAAYPTEGAGIRPLIFTAVLTITVLGITPTLIDRLSGEQLLAQAEAWERVAAHTYSFDAHGAAAVYEARPQIGRRLRTVRPSCPLWATFFLRDLIGQIRTPAQSVATIAVMAAAATVITLSLHPSGPLALLVATAGVFLFASTGPLARGLQHAARVTGDYPLYGISDGRLILLHALFPLTVLLATLAITCGVTATTAALPLGSALTTATALGLFMFGLRVANAFKGSLPPGLLTPVNTQVGDLGIVLRIAWSFSEYGLAAMGTLSITVVTLTPIPFAIISACTAFLIWIRWVRRR